MPFKPVEGLNVEVVYYEGRRYRRYPDSDKRNHRLYYQRSTNRGIRYLHRDIWESHNGPIPPRHQVHHIDGNPSNNDIANLECVTFAEHRRRHADEYRERNTSARQLAHLERIRPLTKAWHRSPEGREWHRLHAAESIHKC